ncbi:unnamed protein product [Dovyalis caffra]|uniref:Uncharacterized protein n=1 Tax=Dovyalis caffra TaxID=77055 RepID=A0AAV1QUX8_9ROSI|nr:unnamed protein product [Dovyalis caffra]CAK7328626.1 unnamed protein product [Dovyalis caffra]
MPSQGKLGPTYVSVAARERTTQSRQVLATAFQTGPREASHGRLPTEIHEERTRVEPMKEYARVELIRSKDPTEQEVTKCS